MACPSPSRLIPKKSQNVSDIPFGGNVQSINNSLTSLRAKVVPAPLRNRSRKIQRQRSLAGAR